MRYSVDKIEKWFLECDDILEYEHTEIIEYLLIKVRKLEVQLQVSIFDEVKLQTEIYELKEELKELKDK